jgi:hypothetical protein
MNQLPVLIGSLRYEFHMQVHRRAVWITMIVLGLLLAFLLTRHNGLNDVLTFLNSPLLVGIAALVMYMLPRLLEWQQSRQ